MFALRRHLPSFIPSKIQASCCPSDQMDSIGIPLGSIDRDKRRIEGMRARNISRTNRFLDARLRTIGLDTDGLDAQMRERRARDQTQKIAAEAEHDRNEFVYQQVALQEAEERRLRDEEFARLRSEWMVQMRAKAEKDRGEKERIHAMLDFDACGSSALQKMSGEDLDKGSRILRQQQQMRAWSRQQASERAAREEAAAREATTHAAYLQRVNDKQRELAEIEEAERRTLNLSIKEENQRRAAERAEELAKEKQEEQAANGRELQHRDSFLREEEDEDAVRGRQGFRGLTRKQKADLLQDNERMRADELRKAEREREEAMAWHVKQEKMRMAMDQSEQEECRRVKEAEADVLREQHRQLLELRQRAMKERHDRFGDIDYTHGLYAGFGKSCR